MSRIWPASIANPGLRGLAALAGLRPRPAPELLWPVSDRASIGALAALAGLRPRQHRFQGPVVPPAA